MHCPIDNTELIMSDRQGLEIDYCPKCRGVWLDRGELDKIIDRASDAESPVAAKPESRNQQINVGYEKQPHKRKRESFLSDIFDF